MKKKCIPPLLWNVKTHKSALPKIPVIMKSLFYAYLLGSASLAYASNTYAQTTMVSINMKNQTVKEVLKEIENTTEYSFFYNNRHVDLGRKVSVDVSNGDIFEVLDNVFRGTNVSYSVKDKSIVFSLKEQSSAVSQQDKKITGTVIDASGMPIIGANIMVKGTTNGTITDMDGKFVLNVPDGAVLQISYIGYTNQEIKVGNKSELSITLKEDTETLDEVVVVGYGVQKKVNLTGAVVSITAKTLADRPISNVSQGLQGMAPGVTVTNSGGQPGMDKGNIVIRGMGSFNGSSPMVLIDGVEGDMNVIDPQDIENISVLKDASSAAIYGSKAANGVILITTKRGKLGSPKISYSGLFGWSSPSDLMKRTSSAELAELTNEAEYWEAISNGMTQSQAEKSKLYSQEDINLFRNGSDPYGHPNTDWYDLFYTGSGFMNRHNVGFEGGSDMAKYRASLGYTKQEGIVENTSNRQFNARTNIDFKLTDKLNARVNMEFINTLTKEPTNPLSWDANGPSYQTFRQVNRISPMVPYKNEDGSYGVIADGNPIAWQDLGSTGDTDKDYIKAFAEVSYDILEGLKLTANGSYYSTNEKYTLFRKEIQYNPNKYDGPNRLIKRNNREVRKQGDILLTYDKKISQKHTVNALAGVHSELFEYEYLDAYRQNFPSSDVTDMNGGSVVDMRNSGYTRELAMNSFFARLKYNYADKYLVEGNVRADGSSRFADGHRWGVFPSFSGAWRITNEEFIKDTGFNRIVTDMKLRGSWGMLGNQDVRGDYYPYINTYGIGSKYPFGNSIHTGAVQMENKINDISWEKTTTWGIAVDITLFNELQMTLEYYNRKTTGILMQVNVPNTYGYAGYWDNVGKMKNQGLELQLNWHKQIGPVMMNFGGNFTFNHNEVLSLGNVDEQIGGRKINRVGEEYGAYFGYKSAGIFQNQAEIDAAPKYTMISNDRLVPGDIKLVDVNGDNVIDSKDRVVLQSENPKYTFAFNVGAKWKMFDANLFFQGAAGVSRYFDDEFYGEFQGDSGHPSAHWLKRWTPDNPTNKWPRASKFRTYNLPGTTMSDFWLVNANYLRLKDVQIGFTIPSNWLSKIKVGSCRIYYSGANLITFTKVPQGTDPESPAGWGAYYPHTKTHSIGINLTL